MVSESVKALCKDFTKIKNYEKAIADAKTWDCHHKLETHNSDGERRFVELSSKELIVLDMYYNRPAEELIFLTKAEHTRLHKKGKTLSEETKKRISESQTGKRNPHYGKHLSEETKKKISDACKGKHKRRGNDKLGVL